MPKQPLSVTLERDNLVWLRGVAARGKRKSLSDALDDILTRTRLGGARPGESRSIVGTVDIAADDPDLSGAGEYIAALFSSSLAKPMVAKESASKYATSKRTRRRG